jgi:fumarate reductase subunit C
MIRNSTLLFLLFMSFSVIGRSQDRFAKNDMSTARYVKFYPNPATTFINIELQKNLDKNCSFQIYNFSGKKIVDMQVSDRARIDLTAYSRGIYIIQLKDRNGKTIEAGKFQIEK